MMAYLNLKMRNFLDKEKLNKKTNRLKTDIPALFLALKDSETPIIAKIFAALTVCYALSPIDMIPDFIPVLGYIDDLIILPAMVTITVKLIPDKVWKRSRESAVGMWQNGKPKKWYYALPVIIFLFLILFVIIKLIVIPAVMK